MSRRDGFTLLEIAVVVFIAALLAAVVSVAFARTLGEKRLENVVGALKEIDSEARRRARREGTPGVVRFDLGRGTITQEVVRTRDPPKEYRLSRRLRIERLLVAGDDGRRSTHGVVAIPVSTNGQTPSYAVFLSGREEEDATVLLFAGLSGQVRVLDDRDEAEELFGAHLRRDAR